MKILGITVFALSSIFTSFNAFADVTCVAQKVANHQASMVCGSATIPSDSTVSMNLACDDYKININCDLHGHNFKLALSISGPNNTHASNAQNSDLNLIDSSGNGALVHCSIDN